MDLLIECAIISLQLIDTQSVDAFISFFVFFLNCFLEDCSEPSNWQLAHVHGMLKLRNNHYVALPAFYVFTC
jgi:hypothetical protein